MFLIKMRFIALCCIIMACCCSTGYAQQDSVIDMGNNASFIPAQPRQLSVLDSVVAATKAHEKFMIDSLAMLYVKAPDAAINQAYMDKVLKENLYHGYEFLDIPAKLKSTVRD